MFSERGGGMEFHRAQRRVLYCFYNFLYVKRIFINVPLSVLDFRPFVVDTNILKLYICFLLFQGELRSQISQVTEEN